MGRLEKFFEKFWWTRGAAAAFALTAIGSKLLDLKQYEFLELFYALIVGWDSLVSWIGKVISIVMPFDIGPTTVNALLVCFATLWPYCFIRILDSIKDSNPLSRRIKGILRTSLITIVVTVLLAYISILVDRTATQIESSLHFVTEATWEIVAEYETQEGFDPDTKQQLDNDMIACLNSEKPFSCVYETADDLHDFVREYLRGNDITEESVIISDQKLSRSKRNFLLLTIFVLLSGAVFFCVCCHLSKMFRRGAYHILVFFITVEALYFLPFIGDYLSRAADAVIKPT